MITIQPKSRQVCGVDTAAAATTVITVRMMKMTTTLTIMILKTTTMMTVLIVRQ